MGFLGNGYGMAIGLNAKFPNYDAIQLKKDELAQARQDRLDKIAAQDAAKGEAIAQRVAMGVSADLDKLHPVIAKQYLDKANEYITDMYINAAKNGGMYKYAQTPEFSKKLNEYKSYVGAAPVENTMLHDDLAKTESDTEHYAVRPEWHDAIANNDPETFRGLTNGKIYTRGQAIMNIEPPTDTEKNLKGAMQSNAKVIGVAKNPITYTDSVGNVTSGYMVTQKVDPKTANKVLEDYWNNNEATRNKWNNDLNAYKNYFQYTTELKPTIKTTKEAQDMVMNFGGNSHGGNKGFAHVPTDQNFVAIQSTSGVGDNPIWQSSDANAFIDKEKTKAFKTKDFKGKYMGYVTDNNGKATDFAIYTEPIKIQHKLGTAGYTDNIMTNGVETIPAQMVYVPITQKNVNDYYAKTKTAKDKRGAIPDGWDYVPPKYDNGGNKAEATTKKTFDPNDIKSFGGTIRK